MKFLGREKELKDVIGELEGRMMQPSGRDSLH